MDLPDLLVIAGAVGLGAFVKSITGIGLPLIAIPALAIFVGVEEAVVVMALPSFLTNVWLLWEHRRGARTAPDLPVMVATGLVGALLGARVLDALSERALAVIFAVIITLYVVVFLTVPQFRIPDRLRRRTAPVAGFVSGVVHGATGASGPVLVPYVHALKLDRTTYLFSTTTLLAVFSAGQIAGIAIQGLYTWDRFLESLVALVPVALTFPIGIRLARRMGTRYFDYAVLGVLAVTVAVMVANEF